MILETFAYVFEGKLDPLKKGLTEAEKQANKATKATEKTDKAAQHAGESLVSFMRKVAGFAGIALTAQAAINNTLSRADSIIHLDNLSRSIGSNVENLDALGRAAQRAGGSAEGMQTSLTSLNEAIKTALTDGTSEARKSFNMFGISLRDSQGHVKDTDDVLLSLSETMRGMDRIKAETIAKKFGITDQSTIEMLMKGKKAVQELTAAERSRSLVNIKSIDATRKFNTSLNNLRMSVGDLRDKSIIDLFPALEKLFDKLNIAAIFAMENEEAMKSLALGISIVLLPAMIRLAVATLAATWPALLLIAAGLALGVVIDDLWTFLKGGPSIIGRVVKAFNEWVEQNPAVKKSIELIVDTVEWMKNKIIKIMEMVGKVLLAVFDPQTYIDGFTYLFHTVDKIMKGIIEFLKSPMKALRALRDAFFDIIPDSLKSFFGIETEVINKEPIHTNPDTNSDVPKLTPEEETRIRERELIYSNNSNSDVPKITPMEEVRIAIPKIDAANNHPLNAMNTTTLNNQRSNISNDTRVNIDNITINTQSTDPDAINKAVADSMQAELENAINRNDDALLA